MKYELILIRYGEIALKGIETRNRFENILVNNIKKALESKKIIFKTKKERGRIYVFTDQIKDSISVLKKIFVITSISPAVKINSEMNSMSEFAVKFSKENKLTKNKSFALRVTRTGSHVYSSQDVAVKLGNDIVKATNAKVDLTNPDFKLFIEIRNKDAYFYVDKIRCMGGMPYKSQGNVLCLADNINSILASWYLVRRGCNVIILYSGNTLAKVIDNFSKNWFLDLKKTTIKPKDDLYRAIDKICSDNSCEAVVTGFLIDDMKEINNLTKNCNLPILHPLIAMDKEEINKKNKEIGLKI